MQPKWQKAKLTRPIFAGATLWIVSEPPILHPNHLISAITRMPVPVEPSYQTNLFDENGSNIRSRARGLELLPEFADEVPIQSWEEFRERISH